MSRSATRFTAQQGHAFYSIDALSSAFALFGTVYFVLYTIGIAANSSIGQPSLVYIAILGIGGMFTILWIQAKIYNINLGRLDSYGLVFGFFGAFALIAYQGIVAYLVTVDFRTLFKLESPIGFSTVQIALSPQALALWYGMGGIAEEVFFNLAIYGFLVYLLKGYGIAGVAIVNAVTAVAFGYFHFYVILPTFPGVLTSSPVINLPGINVQAPYFLLTPYGLSLMGGRVILNLLPSMVKAFTGTRTVLSAMMAHFILNFLVVLV